MLKYCHIALWTFDTLLVLVDCLKMWHPSYIKHFQCSCKIFITIFSYLFDVSFLSHFAIIQSNMVEFLVFCSWCLSCMSRTWLVRPHLNSLNKWLFSIEQKCSNPVSAVLWFGRYLFCHKALFNQNMKFSFIPCLHKTKVI